MCMCDLGCARQEVVITTVAGGQCVSAWIRQRELATTDSPHQISTATQSISFDRHTDIPIGDTEAGADLYYRCKWTSRQRWIRVSTADIGKRDILNSRCISR
jgi:hypothetical protein